MNKFMLYRLTVWMLTPLLKIYLRIRVRLGKEDKSRLSERYGFATMPRPFCSRLIWFHCASVGECQSALPLIHKILAGYPDMAVLLTSGTKTSAEFVAPHLSPRFLHQYVPLDQPQWVARFLDHWHPNLGVWVESELWPNLIAQSKKSGMELILLNARMSEKSFQQWQKMPSFIHYVTQSFSLVLAQNETYARYFAALGAQRVEISGNMKFAAEPLPYVMDELRQWQNLIGSRKVWLAASTHEGEEKSIAAAHQSLRRDYPDLLTIIAPRHPQRSAKIQLELKSMRLLTAVRSQKQLPTAQTDIYLADTIGELGLFFALCKLVFIGGSLRVHGGHNLLEPARYGCAILYGPHMENFADLHAAMQQYHAAQLVHNDMELQSFASRLLSDREAVTALGQRAKQIAYGQDQILDGIFARLEPWLGPPVSGQKNYANA